MKRLSLALVVFGFFGCTFLKNATKRSDPRKEFADRQAENHARMLAIIERGKRIQIEKGNPPKNYIDAGPITAVDGGADAGGRGTEGTFDRAMVALRARAIEVGADFVQIITVRPPHYAPAETNIVIRALTPSGCPDPAKYVYTYEISGIAFKAPND